METMRRMKKEEVEAGDRRTMMVMMHVGDQFFFTPDSTRWEAKLPFTKIWMDRDGTDHTPISTDGALTRVGCTGHI